MSVDINELYNEMCEKYTAVVAELEYYKDKFVPKYNVAEKLFAIDIREKKIVNLNVDEIVINNFGVHYREYVGENGLIQYPEQYCFNKSEEAEKYLNELKGQ